MSAEGVFNNPSSLNGRSVYDRDGDKIGSIGQVYVGDRTGRPEWVTVRTGLFGMKESLVPLSGARRAGEDVHVPYAKETVKEAPRLDADEHLDPGQEKQLYQHYGLTAAGGIGTAAGMGTAAGGRTRAGTGTSTGSGMSTGRAATPEGTRGPAMAGSATRGADLGDMRTGEKHGEELIRSEEELHVTTEEREVGHARLRKVVVTENVTTSVPLSHEEVRVVHEAISPEDRNSVRSMRIGEAQTEVTLHADQPVISKESIPVERVRMETEKVTEQREVSAEVRKEQIEYDTDQEEMKGTRGKRGPGR
ncbi:PRC and DUF2382 domain-containing protein [Streptomyces sp. NPDC101062]|uniref:PRC and DUF2382 domain-containing protein n=1 Tax=unclassified Streptomyces TaxID=2593676 RepID=UPI002E79DCA0|nr:PRC and DUF2382 domain-containing protein [Streptomyces sp. JV176]MEE1800834.1 PRC and DUF2382 domain-containing protein [Streptomyces sp. JV176]